MIEGIYNYGIEYALMALGIFLVVREFNRVVGKIDELIDAVRRLNEDRIRTERRLDEHEKRLNRLEK